MKTHLIIAFVSFPLFFFLFVLPNTVSKNFNVKYHSNDSLITITISVVGDIMCHSVQYKYAHVTADSFDFNPVYREIKKYLSSSDFTFGNLETVTAGKANRYSGYPYFNSPDNFIAALKDAGFNLLSTANNHALDKGEAGLLRTIEQLKKNSLNYNGTFLSREDRDSIRIYNIHGIKTAFLAYTYGTNGNPIPSNKKYLINLIDFNLISRDIKNARLKGAEIVIVHFHFGEEYKREPSSYQIDVVNKTIALGADVIIGGHPHVLQKAEKRKSNLSKVDSVFIAYSMGNFISNQRWRYSDAGAILTINITKDMLKDSLYISGVDFIPTWVFKGKTENGLEYVILPAEKALNDSVYKYLLRSDYDKLTQAFQDTKKIFTSGSYPLKLNRINNSLNKKTIY